MITIKNVGGSSSYIVRYQIGLKQGEEMLETVRAIKRDTEWALVARKEPAKKT